jgi:hypothetical protein
VQCIPQMTYLCMPCGYFWQRTSSNSVMAKFAEPSLRAIQQRTHGTVDFSHPNQVRSMPG